MQIEKHIEIIDLALLLYNNVLVIADTHIGYEEALNKQGLLVPRFQFREIIRRLDGIFAILEKRKIILEKIIINGDIKHEFGTISETEWRQTLQLLDYLGKHAPAIVLIKGNHDTILGLIAKKRNVEIKKYERVADILIAHGDDEKIPLQNVKTIIIGHEHPAITLTQSGRMESYKGFLMGTYKKKVLVVQPSFNLVVEGTNILKEELLSPFLKDGIKKFRVIVVEDKPYDFGLVKGLLR